MRVLNKQTETVSIDALRPHPKNPRQGDVGAIHESLQNNGWYGSIIAQKSTGLILAGNHRWEAARQAGMDEVPVTWVDVEDDHALRILLADNRTNDLASYNDAALAELLKELSDATGTLAGTGFDGDDLDELLTELGQASAPSEAPEAQTDKAEELREKWQTERGQLWQIGRHRLLCGDSMNAEDVARLLGSQRPILMPTDPPYGVEYDSSWRSKYSSGEYSVGKIANDDKAEWADVWRIWDVPILYVWHGGLHADVVAAGLKHCGYDLRAQIIWNKKVMVFGRGAYHWKHEPCWYAVKRGANANWQGDRSQTTVWDVGNGSGAGRTGDEADDFHANHISQKPVELSRRPILNHTKKSDVIAEPFAGSGGCLVAAEETERICLAMEYEPKYVAVTLQRLADMGLKPELQTQPADAS